MKFYLLNKEVNYKTGLYIYVCVCQVNLKIDIYIYMSGKSEN